jgi:hypothetical protein
LYARLKFPRIRKPAKKVQSGIIWRNGRRTGSKRLKGDLVAIHRTMVVQVKCHIANDICIFFNWGSLKILYPKSVAAHFKTLPTWSESER